MKLKINKACDLNSISVFPPQSRRFSSMPNGSQMSQLRPPMSQQSFSQGMPSQAGNMSLASQLRSQPSQQVSLSQGVSSQQGILSQLSQNPLDDTLTNDMRCKSQESENLVKKGPGFPGVRYISEDQKMSIARASASVMRDKNGEMDRRLGGVETSLNKYGMILNSVQTDVIQVNRGTKEVTLEMEAMRQKLTAVDTALQQLIKRQDDDKLTANQISNPMPELQKVNAQLEKFQQISSKLSAIPEELQSFLQKMKNELRMSMANFTQVVTLPPKLPTLESSPYPAPPVTKVDCSTRTDKLIPTIPKVETGGWRSVRLERSPTRPGQSYNLRKKDTLSSVKLERGDRIVIDSDEEIEQGFFCLIDEKDKGLHSKIVEETMQDAERIIRRARKRKRKSSNPIIIQ